MSAGEGFRERLSEGPPLLLDAAMGTELGRRGSRTALPLWSAWALLETPETVLAIHRAELSAGADVLTANTFRTHWRSLAKGGFGDRAAELTSRAVALAKRAAARAGRQVFVAGSLSPLEDCYRPELAPEETALASEHAVQARALALAGVDVILAETHNSVRELSAATRAAAATGLPVVASMVTDGRGRILSGETVEEGVRAAVAAGAEAIGVNCVPARLLGGDLALAAAAVPGKPLGAWGNLGPPTDENETRFEGKVSPEEYASLAAEWVALGARLVGGCCGTTAAHTAALRALCDGLTR
jgi:S-methylmethionine-dependent homocysteine/selenocysteine methylase